MLVLSLPDIFHVPLENSYGNRMINNVRNDDEVRSWERSFRQEAIYRRTISVEKDNY